MIRELIGRIWGAGVAPRRTLKASGRLRLWIDGVQVADRHNLIVDTGLDAIVALVLGTDPTKLVVSVVAGTGTTAPAAGDTALQTPTFTKTLTSSNTPGTGALYYTFDILPGEATGSNFTEFGLECADGATLFSRWVDGATYTKTAGNTISGTWDITFTT